MASNETPDQVALPRGWEPHGHRTIAVDFDGVIHSYTATWSGAHIIPDPPVLGVLPWMRVMMEDFRIVIFSTRCQVPEGCQAVKDYLRRDHYRAYDRERGVVDIFQKGLGELVDHVDCTDRKPAALIYLDDRAMRFDGVNLPSVDDINQAIPWNRRAMGDSMRVQ